LFFKTVQNKLHYASHGKTAAEIISQRADSQKDNMGLKSFKGAKVRKSDVGLAKNYLEADELDILNRIVTMYLDYAELQAKNNNPMHMTDWEQKLNKFLSFNDREILDNAGSITAQIAKELAEFEYEKFDGHRKLSEGDIDGIKKRIEDINE